MTNRGSTALNTWVIPCSRARLATSSALDASTRAATSRASPARRAVAASTVALALASS